MENRKNCPDQRECHIENAHESIEMKHRLVFRCEKSIGTGEFKDKRRVEVIYGAHLKLEDINSIFVDRQY